jgi:hypothetical protein
MGAKYQIYYNYDTDDYAIFFYFITNNIKETLISRSEIIGYFPSVFKIDDSTQTPKNKSSIDEYVEFIKKFNIPENYKEIYFQFESWLDNIVELPDELYHVFNIKSKEKILRYGLEPKSNNKISYHPDRIYFSSSIRGARSFINQLDKNQDYEIAVIDKSIIDKRYKLLIRKDPNYDDGYYTCQNISPFWISKIIK